VLRFSTAEVMDGISEVMNRIADTISDAKGLVSDGTVPRRFVTGSTLSQQLALLDEPAPYDHVRFDEK
jgi:hypothetical protein